MDNVSREKLGTAKPTQDVVRVSDPDQLPIPDDSNGRFLREAMTIVRDVYEIARERVIAPENSRVFTYDSWVLVAEDGTLQPVIPNTEDGQPNEIEYNPDTTQLLRFYVSISDLGPRMFSRPISNKGLRRFLPVKPQINKSGLMTIFFEALDATVHGGVVTSENGERQIKLVPTRLGGRPPKVLRFDSNLFTGRDGSVEKENFNCHAIGFGENPYGLFNLNESFSYRHVPESRGRWVGEKFVTEVVPVGFEVNDRSGSSEEDRRLFLEAAKQYKKIFTEASRPRNEKLLASPPELLK